MARLPLHACAHCRGRRGLPSCDGAACPSYDGHAAPSVTLPVTTRCYTGCIDEPLKHNTRSNHMDPATATPVDIVFSFDTTGSMAPAITQVRRNVTQTVQRLFNQI